MVLALVVVVKSIRPYRLCCEYIRGKDQLVVCADYLHIEKVVL